MFGFERKIWAFVREHLLLFLMIFVTLLSLLMRYSMRDYVSDDMICALSPWYDEIRAGGGLAALGRQVGNYNIPYQTLIALLTYLPIAPLYGYKVISVIFDYLLAAAAGILVWKLTKDRLRAVLAYAAVTVLPPVIMNSAMWAAGPVRGLPSPVPNSASMITSGPNASTLLSSNPLVFAPYASRIFLWIIMEEPSGGIFVVRSRNCTSRPLSIRRRPAARPSAPLLPGPAKTVILRALSYRFVISSATASAALSISTIDGIPIFSEVRRSASAISLPVRIYFIVISAAVSCRMKDAPSG